MSYCQHWLSVSVTATSLVIAVVSMKCSPGKALELTAEYHHNCRCHIFQMVHFIHLQVFLFFLTSGLWAQYCCWRPWGWMSSQTWISLDCIFSGCADAPWRKPNCSTSLSVACPVSAAYSQALLQGLKLGPFVLTNVTTCKLFLAPKKQLKGLDLWSGEPS